MSFLTAAQRLSYLQAGHGLCLGAEKLEARKMLVNRTESPLSTVRFVGRFFLVSNLNGYNGIVTRGIIYFVLNIGQKYFSKISL